jgi:modulator of FtsH protease
MAVGFGHGVGLVMMLAAMGLIWFVLPRTANSATGIVVVFAFTGLIGAGLGPMLNQYLKLANGASIIMQALGGTAAIFLGLSAYTLTTRKDFSFLRGFVAVGMILMLVIGLFLAGASILGYDFSVFSLMFSAGIVLLMSAAILFQTSEIIHGGETNYLLATTSLYLSIVNLFMSLLRLLGAAEE